MVERGGAAYFADHSATTRPAAERHRARPPRPALLGHLPSAFQHQATLFDPIRKISSGANAASVLGDVHRRRKRSAFADLPM